MAFNRPLEADRVDDLGFLSSFVRSPLVGPIMWVLGNHLSRDVNEQTLKRSTVQSSLEQTSKENWVPNSSDGIRSNSLLASSRKSQESGLNTLTDIPNDHGNTTTKDVSTCDITKNTKEIGPQRAWRKTSWSDESGQNLVEYFDPNDHLSRLQLFTQNFIMCPLCLTTSDTASHALHSTKQQSVSDQLRAEPSNINQPIKSAMRNKNYKQNIPKGLSGGFIRYPSGGKHSNGNGKPNTPNTNGYISPQYGWYISTTPPTPDYHANVNTRSSSDEEGLQDDQKLKNTISPIQESTPKFHKKMPNYCGGWPTVPL